LGGIALMELFQYLKEPPTPILDRLYAQLVGTYVVTRDLCVQVQGGCFSFVILPASHSLTETQLGYQPFGKVLTLEAFCGFVLVFGLLNRAEILKCTHAAMQLSCPWPLS
jgi:glycerol uptake facilitator-like aquaporin